MAKGSYLEVLSGRLDNLPTLNSRLVRIFISSTFTDTKEERNLLLEDVYPKLKSHCKEMYGMDFQLVDMRWGVPIDAADDHLASKICMEEIQNCQKLSTGPNFVTFLNQKHGYRPLQLTIPEEEFMKLVSCLQQHGKDTGLMEKWYIKDENQIPAVYVLQPISSLILGYKDKQNQEAREEWEMVFNTLREDFKFASKKCQESGQLTEEEKHKYFMSDCLECQDGFIRHGLSCYHFSHDTETWVDAANVCNMIYGGYLVEVNDPVESNFLINMSKRDNTDYWIGGDDLKVEGEWRWYHTNQPIASDLWAKGQPSNDNGDENCMEIMVTLYNDDACHKPQRYICETSEISGEIVG